MKKQPFQYSATEIQTYHHNTTLGYRAQDRIFQSEIFVKAWKRATEDERKYVSYLCYFPNSDKLKKWVLKIMIGGLGQYPTSTLRQLASYHQIRNYSRMTKTCLLNALTLKGETDGGKNI